MNKVLVFGDSIAGGVGVKSESSWVQRLAMVLEKKLDFVIVQNLSVPGNSTIEVLRRFDFESQARIKLSDAPGRVVIIFAIGINDSNKNTLKIFESSLKKLFRRSKKYTENIIFIGLTSVDEYRCPAGFNNKKIITFNKISKNFCKANKIRFIDLIENWPKENYQETFCNDGLHPNERGHRIIFSRVAPEVLKAFNKNA